MTPLTATATAWRLDPEGATTALDDGSTLRLRFLSPSMARLALRPATGWREPRTWAIAPEPGSDVPWEGRARDDDSGFTPPPLQVFDAEGAPGLDAGALAVTLQHAPLRLRWTAGRGGPLLAEDRRTTAYLRSARTGAVRHYLQRDLAERYHGLGDKTGPLNLHGRRLRTLAMDSLGYDPEHGDPLYKHWPFVLSRTPQGRWLGLYYDTLAACTFDLGCEHDNYHGFYRHVEIDDGDLDLYLMAGATPGEVIAQFVRLIGGTALPPRWALGYAQTAMGLADAPDAQARLHAFIDEIRAHRMPVSAFHYGSGYSMRGPRRYVYTWNRDKFPEPQALNARFHQAGLHVVANIKPCLLDDHPAFETLARDGGFVVDGQGRPVVEPYWDGQAAFLDFTHPAGLRWWQEGLRRQILDMGIDAGWNDNNEHAVQDEAAQSHGFGAPMPIHRSRPLHALLMTRATWEAQRERAAPGEPVYTVTRAGPPGIQRYAQTWSRARTRTLRPLGPGLLPEPAHGDELVEGRQRRQPAVDASGGGRHRARGDRTALPPAAHLVAVVRACGRAARAHHPPDLLRLPRRRAVPGGQRRLHARPRPARGPGGGAGSARAPRLAAGAARGGELVRLRDPRGLSLGRLAHRQRPAGQAAPVRPRGRPHPGGRAGAGRTRHGR
jgi:alpha-glucosidase